MSRSDWRIVAAVVGVLSLGCVVGGYQYLDRAIEHERAKYAYQPARDSTDPRRLVTGQPHSKNYDPHCNDAVDREDSDLCAQWSAVEAVNKGNGLVRIGLWLSAIGILITATGTIMLVRTLQQSEAALVVARDANKLSQLAFHAEQRAWIAVSVKMLSGIRWNINGGNLDFQVTMTNAGKVPAVVYIVHAAHILSDARDYAPPVLTRSDIERGAGKFSSVVLPGQPGNQPIGIVTKREAEMLDLNPLMIVIYVDYLPYEGGDIVQSGVVLYVSPRTAGLVGREHGDVPPDALTVSIARSWAT